MKKLIISEEERIEILKSHKKLISEQGQQPDRSGFYQTLGSYSEVEGEMSEKFFEDMGIGSFSDEITSSNKPKCPPITDSSITVQFDDDSKLLRYPNDTRYGYLKINDKWFAKNLTNKKVFNITDCGFENSVKLLDKQFPNP
jgi:hypothetical protein